MWHCAKFLHWFRCAAPSNTRMSEVELIVKIALVRMKQHDASEMPVSFKSVRSEHAFKALVLKFLGNGKWE